MELENSTIDIPGVNDALFDVVHSVALTTLGVSFIACVVVLVHLRYGCDAFYKKALADRLVFYLGKSYLIIAQEHKDRAAAKKQRFNDSVCIVAKTIGR